MRLHPLDRAAAIARYEGRLAIYGYDPRTLGWPKGRQDVRFRVLARYALENPGCSVLDVGCGFADLYEFLTAKGWRGDYTGLELVPGLARKARELHPGLRIVEGELLELAGGGRIGQHDLVFASGVFHARLEHTPQLAYIFSSLRAMFTLARVVVACDFMTSFVDYQQPQTWHTDPGWAMAAGRALSRRVVILADYMPYEFALFIFKSDHLDARGVFREFN